MTMERRSKRAGAAEALAGLRDGDTLAIGGSLFHNKPMSLVREIVRRRIEQAEFVARGIASLDAAKGNGQFVDADVVVPRLRSRLNGAGRKVRRSAAAKR
mgnify:CR=1 FL=1